MTAPAQRTQFTVADKTRLVTALHALLDIPEARRNAAQVAEMQRITRDLGLHNAFGSLDNAASGRLFDRATAMYTGRYRAQFNPVEENHNENDG